MLEDGVKIRVGEKCDNRGFYYLQHFLARATNALREIKMAASLGVQLEVYDSEVPVQVLLYNSRKNVTA